MRGDGLRARLVAQRLLEEGGRSVFALVEVDVGVIGQLLERQAGRVDQRVACRQRHARGRLDQLHELEAGGVEARRQAPSAVAEVSNTTPSSLSPDGHVVDDALRGAVAERVVVGVAAQRQHRVRERLDIEQVMLPGNGEIVCHGKILSLGAAPRKSLLRGAADVNQVFCAVAYFALSRSSTKRFALCSLEVPSLSASNTMTLAGRTPVWAFSAASTRLDTWS